MKEKLIAAVSRRKTPLMFVASSLTLSAADFLVSNLLYYLIIPGNRLISVPAGRLTGALVGFILNRSVVFRGRNGHWLGEAWTLLKYAALWIANNYAAIWLIGLIQSRFAAEYWVAWIAAASLLYLPNFLLQRYVVFSGQPGGIPAGTAAGNDK